MQRVQKRACCLGSESRHLSSIQTCIHSALQIQTASSLQLSYFPGQGTCEHRGASREGCLPPPQAQGSSKLPGKQKCPSGGQNVTTARGIKGGWLTGDLQLLTLGLMHQGAAVWCTGVPTCPTPPGEGWHPRTHRLHPEFSG